MSAIFSNIKAADRAAIVDIITARARMAGLSETKVWIALCDFWTPGPAETAATLLSRTIKFIELVKMPAQTEEPRPAHAAGKFATRRARVRRPRLIRTVPPRPEYWTRSDAAVTWNAGSVLMQLHGVCFNALMVFRHDLLCRDEDLGPVEVSDFVHGLGQQLKREAGAQERLHYIYRHRRTGRDGFTTAIICHIPPLWSDAMSAWIDGFIERRFGSSAHRRGVHVRMTDHGHAKQRVRRHWRLVRGLLGCLDPTIEVRHQGRMVPLVKVLRVPSVLQRNEQPLPVKQRYRVSETIGASVLAEAREQRMACLSAFRDHAWANLMSGWELMEHHDRRREAAERDQAIALLTAHWPEGRDALHDHRRQAELDRLRASWPDDPQIRSRSWLGWWLGDEALLRMEMGRPAGVFPLDRHQTDG